MPTREPRSLGNYKIPAPALPHILRTLETRPIYTGHVPSVHVRLRGPAASAVNDSGGNGLKDRGLVGLHLRAE